MRLGLLGGLDLAGTVRRTGADWLLVEDAAGREWLVRHAALAVVRGASGRAVPDDALGVLRRLPLRAVLRRLADDDADCVLHLVDGAGSRAGCCGWARTSPRCGSRGRPATEGYDVVPLAAVAAVQPRRLARSPRSGSASGSDSLLGSGSANGCSSTNWLASSYIRCDVLLELAAPPPATDRGRRS